MRLRSSRTADGTLLAPGAGQVGEHLSVAHSSGLSLDQRRAVVEHQEKTGQSFAEAATELGYAVSTPAPLTQRGPTLFVEGDDSLDPLVVIAFDRDDPMARTARKLRSAISSGVRADGAPIRSVAIVGLDAPAETPVLAANLAVACAQSGTSTLLIDAELEAPHQHLLFRARNDIGLGDLLSGDAASGGIESTPIGGLSLLPSGQTGSNAPELLDRQRLANAIELFTEDYALIVVDAGSGPNAVAAAFGLDAVLVTVRRNVTSSRELKLLVEQLQVNGQHVLGTVLVD